MNGPVSILYIFFVKFSAENRIDLTFTDTSQTPIGVLLFEICIEFAYGRSNFQVEVVGNDMNKKGR